jgi:hypothetical protein
MGVRASVVDNVPREENVQSLRRYADFGNGIVEIEFGTDIMCGLGIDGLVALRRFKYTSGDVLYLLDRVVNVTTKQVLPHWQYVLDEFPYHPALAHMDLPADIKVCHTRWLARQVWVHAVVSQ